MDDAWEVTWPAYVRRHAGNARPTDIGVQAQVHPGTVSRWLGSDNERPKRPGDDHVRKFAIAYGRPVIEALVAAGYLSADDAKDGRSIELGTSLDRLTADELLGEIRRRIPEDTPDIHHVSDFVGSVGAGSEHGVKERPQRG